MAVGAEKAQIFQAVVFVVPINMVKLKREWLTEPVSVFAVTASMLEYLLFCSMLGQ